MDNNKADISIVCSNCQNKFDWTAGEQTFMEGLLRDGKIKDITPPKRCVECRASKKAEYALKKMQSGSEY